MKAIFLLIILAVSMLIALVIQDFLPSPTLLKGAHIVLLPILFAYGALVLPFPAMLVLAIIAGGLTDLSVPQIVNAKVEIGLGSSIIIYAVLGTIMQGVQKAFFRGAWWLHPPLSALCTFLLLTLQYLMIALRRESIFFNETVIWKILIPTIIAFFLSPLIEALFILIERALPNLQRPPRGY